MYMRNIDFGMSDLISITLSREERDLVYDALMMAFTKCSKDNFEFLQDDEFTNSLVLSVIKKLRNHEGVSGN